METTQLPIEYHSETPELTDRLKEKFAQRFHKMAKGHRDLTGASLAVQQTSGDSLPRNFRARIVAYHKPDNLAAVGTDETVSKALRNALDALERQVRDHRDRIRTKKRH